MSSSEARQTKSLFVEALELAKEEREPFLAERCGTADALRARVRGLLEAHDDAGPFLAEPVCPEAAGEAPGTVIGRYKLLQKIGEGGFGSVWMVEQLEPIRRKVALKIIKLGIGDVTEPLPEA